jgi:hypothetical protein
MFSRGDHDSRPSPDHRNDYQTATPFDKIRLIFPPLHSHGDVDLIGAWGVPLPSV